MKELYERVTQQNEEVVIFSQNDPTIVAQLIYEEALELVDATREAYVIDDLTSVIGEVADVYYLLIRYATMLGIDLEDAVEMKIKRNALKYGGQTDKAEARRLWEEQGGDKKFFDELE